MLTPLRSKLGIRIWLVFTLLLLLSLSAATVVGITLINQFGEKSAQENKRIILQNAKAFLAKTAHEQAFRYDEHLRRIGDGAVTIAQKAQSLHAEGTIFQTPTPGSHIIMERDPENGFFCNDASAPTMLLYWGSPLISSETRKAIGRFRHLSNTLENVSHRLPETVACYFVSRSRIAAYFPNIHNVHSIPKGFDIRNAAWYQKAKQTSDAHPESVWSGVYRDILGRGLMVTASCPARSPSGQFIGAAGVDLTLNTLITEILSEIPSPHTLEGMFSFLLDGDGRIIAISPNQLAEFGIQMDPVHLTDSSKIFEHTLKDSSFSSVQAFGERILRKPYDVFRLSLPQKTLLVASHFMPATGWRLNLAIPESRILASVTASKEWLKVTIAKIKGVFWIMALAFSLISLAAAAFLFMRHMIKPLRQLEEGAERVRSGDLETPIAVRGKGEIASLAANFNHMMEGLREGKALEAEYAQRLEREIQEKTFEVKQQNRRLEQEILDRKTIEKALRTQVEIQKTTARSLSKFVAPGDVDAKIHETLKEIGSLAQVDRAYLFNLDKTTGHISNTHEWCAPGIAPQKAHLQDINPETDLPFFWKKMRAHEIFKGPRVAEMPSGAALEKRHFDEQDILSVIVLPLVSGEDLRGFVGFDAVTKQNDWSEDIVSLLEMTVQIIANVLLRQDIEKDLRRSELLFRTLIESAPDAVLLFDKEGNIRRINQAACDVTGYANSELLTMDFPGLHVPVERDQARQHFDQLREKGRISHDSTFLGKNGEPVLMALDAVKIAQDQYLAFCKDTTDKNRLEQELRQAHKMEAIGTLAGGIAHEFNNMLAAILGNAQLAMDDVPAYGAAWECLGQIETASRRAGDMVGQILSFARKGVVSRKPIDLITVVREALNLMRASIPAMVEIKWEMPSEPAVIQGDATEVQQIVMNLCGNAAHAMRKTGGTLTVKLEQRDAISGNEHHNRPVPGAPDLLFHPHIHLVVQDTGHGMSPEVLDKIFDPYFTTKGVGEGTGMGMAVVYGIVKKYEGHIRVHSQPGQGTRVEIFLPVHEKAALGKTPERPSLLTGTEHILLVDDQPAVTKMTQKLLENLGYRVTAFTKSLDALKRFRLDPNDFDLVITDMEMPNMPGDALAQELFQIRPGIPVILCTGHSERMAQEREKRRAIAADDRKPMEKAELARLVREVMDRNKKGEGL